MGDDDFFIAPDFLEDSGLEFGEVRFAALRFEVGKIACSNLPSRLETEGGGCCGCGIHLLVTLIFSRGLSSSEV